MSLYEQWKDLANMQQTQQAQAAFWSEYFNAETENYKKILANKDTVFSGKLSELAKEFGMTDVVFAGFMDGTSCVASSAPLSRIGFLTTLRLVRQT